MELPTPSKETFGTGKFVDELNSPDFFEMPLEDQARFLGQRLGCPIASELVDPQNGRGPEKMINRYGEIGFWYGFITREIEANNRQLHDNFIKAVRRNENEPVGMYEPDSVPEDYTDIMAPTNTIWGFSMPRMLIEHIKTDEDEGLQQRLVDGLAVIQEAATISKSPIELMARTAEGLVGRGANIDSIIVQILGQGWMDEHNAYTMQSETQEALREFAPKLYEYYSNLSDEEKKDKRLC